MGFVVKNDLAKQFSVYGRNGKRALGSTALFTVIYRMYIVTTVVFTSILS